MNKHIFRFGGVLVAASVFVFALLGVLSPYGAIPAYAATTYYVAPTGSNSSSCGASSSPCSGISYTYRNRASCGDTILVQSGTYTDYYAAGFGIYLNKACTASNSIKLQSMTRGSAVIDGQQNSTRFRGFYVDGSYNILDGFRITNNYGEGIGMWGGTHNTFRHNEMDHNGGSWNTTNQNHSGIYTDQTSSYNTYDGNYSHDNGTTSAGVRGHGFYATGSNEIYINNISYNNAGFGFQIYAYNNLTNMQVYNNVSSHNGWAGIVLYTDGRAGESFNGVDIKNNILVNNGWGDTNSTAIKLENDGITSNGGGVAFDTNISYGNANSSTDIQVVGPAPSYTSTNWIRSDPKFVGTTDFHLTAVSPAIDAGITLSSVTTDFDGTTRPQGSAYDIGAYEYKSVAVPTVTLSASPAAITSGQSSTLSWNSTNATSCAGTGFSTGNAISGFVSVSPTTSTTYSVTCIGTGGSASASVTVMVTSPSGGTTYYVATIGSDSSTCGASTVPCRTITYAYSKVTAGDTILVQPGTYTDYTTAWGIYLNKNGSSGAPITLRSVVKHGAIIDGSGVTDPAVRDSCFILYGTSYNIIDGFTIKNCLKNGIAVYPNGSTPSAYDQFINNEISNISNPSPAHPGQGGQGIGISSPDHDISVISNYIHDIGNAVDTKYDHGLYAEGNNNIYANNVFVHNQYGAGMQLSSYSSVSNELVAHNTTANNGYFGVVIWSSGGSFTNLQVENNIAYGNGTYGIAGCSAAGTATISNNLEYNNTVNFVSDSCGGGTMSLNNTNAVQSDPKFVSATDFHLQFGSPAIDKGLTLSSVTTDFDGTTRPQGTAYDIGAYEYTSVVSDTVSPTISIISPASGATVSGTITVAASASDNVGVAGVQFKVDGANLGAEVTTVPYAVSWNTTTASNGSHTLTATARDAAGNTATSTESITVNNPVADTTPPSIPTGLTATAVSSSQINLSWTASTDNVGVAGYKIYRGGTQIATVTTTSYANTGLTAATMYTYTVAAYDVAGNQSAQSSSASATTQSASTQKFQIGDRVHTTAPLNVRSKPRIDRGSQLLGTQPTGALGIVIGGPATGSGYTWWNLNYDNAPDGWSVENYLEKVVAAVPALSPILTQDERSQRIVEIQRQIEILQAQVASLLNALKQ